MGGGNRGTEMKKYTIETIISALRVLARDIESEDGMANLCLYEAADKLESVSEQLTLTTRQLRDAMKLLATAESGLIGNANVVWEQRLEELENEYEK